MMALSQSTLANELADLIPTSTEAEAIKTLANAVEVYALEAKALTNILPAGAALGKEAMKLAMVGISQPVDGVAVAKLSAGLRAFWVGVAGGMTLSFVGATAIVPPLFPGFEAILQGVFTANLANERDLIAASDALATAIHSSSQGGTVTTPPAIISPIV